MSIEKIKEFDIQVIQTISPFNSIEELVEYTKALTDVEGFIVSFDTGHKVKIKANWYVRIHKTIDRVRFDRNIVDLIINENVDDVVPMLPQEQVDRIRDFETRFWEAFNRQYFVLLSLLDEAKTFNSRKEVALKFVPTLQNKQDAQFIFRALDGHNMRELLFEHVRKNISSNAKWDACARWLNID
jgi:RNA ligase